MCMRCLRSPATPKWPGEAIYIGHQVELAVCSRCAFFCVGVGSSGGKASVQPVTHRLILAISLLKRCLLLTQHHQFN